MSINVAATPVKTICETSVDAMIALDYEYNYTKQQKLQLQYNIMCKVCAKVQDKIDSMDVMLANFGIIIGDLENISSYISSGISTLANGGYSSGSKSIKEEDANNIKKTVNDIKKDFVGLKKKVEEKKRYVEGKLQIFINRKNSLYMSCADASVDGFATW